MYKSNFLTKAGFEKLEGELNYLRLVRRIEVANLLRDTMSFDESGPEYLLAIDEQAQVEARIAKLDNLLRTAIIIEEPTSDKEISVGSTVVIQMEESLPETYTIVGSTEANPRKGLISNEAPLGSVLLGRKVGETVEVNAPAGSMKYTIIQISKKP